MWVVHRVADVVRSKKAPRGSAVPVAPSQRQVAGHLAAVAGRAIVRPADMVHRRRPRVRRSEPSPPARNGGPKLNDAGSAFRAPRMDQPSNRVERQNQQPGAANGRSGFLPCPWLITVDGVNLSVGCTAGTKARTRGEKRRTGGNICRCPVSQLAR